MRKLLVSVLSVGLLAGPATVAFAQDRDREQDIDRLVATDLPLRDAEPLDRAQVKVDTAAERVKEKQERIRERRVDRRAEDAQSGADAAAPSPQLQAIAQCESGGDYSANTGNGYYGAYQFSQETWASVGGSGLPSEAPPAEQDMRAQMLLEQAGASQWPVCGQ